VNGVVNGNGVHGLVSGNGTCEWSRHNSQDMYCES